MTTSSPRFTSRALFSSLMIAATLGLAPASISAQEGGDAKTQSNVRASKVELTLDGERVVINKPDGWVVATAPKGSIALFRAAGDTNSQLDVRYTPGIDTKMSAAHFASFHTNLKSMGLKEVATSEVTLKSAEFPKVTQTTYDLTSKGKEYRLVVWHVQRKNAAWFFTYFAPRSADDTTVLDGMVTRITFGS